MRFSVNCSQRNNFKMKILLMKDLFLSMITLFFTFSLTAQPTGAGAESNFGRESANASGFSGMSINSSFGQNFLNDALGGTYAEKNKIAYSNTKGSPFLNKEFVESTLVLNNGSLLTDILIQLDLYANEILTKGSDGEEHYIDKKFYKKIILPFEGRDMVYSRVNPKKYDQFYEILYENEELSFLKERYVTVKEPSNNGITKRPPKFTQRTNYYIMDNKHKLVKVKLKKKDIFASFSGSKTRAMEKYAKDNKIKLKSEEDFISVFQGIASAADD